MMKIEPTSPESSTSFNPASTCVLLIYICIRLPLVYPWKKIGPIRVPTRVTDDFPTRTSV